MDMVIFPWVTRRTAAFLRLELHKGPRLQAQSGGSTAVNKEQALHVGYEKGLDEHKEG